MFIVVKNYLEVLSYGSFRCCSPFYLKKKCLKGLEGEGQEIVQRVNESRHVHHSYLLLILRTIL